MWLPEPPPFPLVRSPIEIPPPPLPLPSPALTGDLEMTLQPYFPGENLLHVLFAYLYSPTADERRAHSFPFAVLSLVRKRYSFTASFLGVAWRSQSSNSRPYGDFLHRNRAALATRLRSFSKRHICIIISIFFKRSSLPGLVSRFMEDSLA